MSVQYCVALPEEKKEVLQFLRESYYLEEPLTIGNEPREQTYEDEEFSISNLQYGTCIKAVEIFADSNKEKIIGIALAGPKYPNEIDHLEELIEKSKTSKWIKLLKLFAVLERRANVFELYNVKNAVHLHVLSVSKESRGKSIGAKLLKKCMEVSKQLGFNLLTTDCTSVFSIRVAEKLNMDCVGTLAFEDYRDEEGEQVFDPPSPHKYIKTFAKLL